MCCATFKIAPRRLGSLVRGSKERRQRPRGVEELVPWVAVTQMRTTGGVPQLAEPINVLNQASQELRHNGLLSSAKRQEKSSEGARGERRNGKPATPRGRLLGGSDVDAARKVELRTERGVLNVFQLNQQLHVLNSLLCHLLSPHRG